MAYTVVPAGPKYYGLSTDIKPYPGKMSDGTELLESDTGREFYIKSGTWQAKAQNTDDVRLELTLIRGALERIQGFAEELVKRL